MNKSLPEFKGQGKCTKKSESIHENDMQLSEDRIHADEYEENSLIDELMASAQEDEQYYEQRHQELQNNFEQQHSQKILTNKVSRGIL